MFRKLASLPWGRTSCILGVLISANALFGATDKDIPMTITLVAFLAAAVALHAIAAFRPR